MSHTWEYTHSPLKNIFHKMEIAENHMLRSALENDLTERLYDDLDFRCENERNVIGRIVGEQGSGKSMSARILKTYLDKRNGVQPIADDWVFDNDQFLKRYRDSSKFTTIIKDDDYDYMTQMGSYRQREQLKLIEQATRSESINILSCSVSEVMNLANYELRAFDIDYKHKTNRLIMYDKGRDMFVGRPLGFVLLDGRKLDPEFEKIYSDLKTEFVRKVKEGSQRDVQAEHDKIAFNLLEKYDFNDKTPKSIFSVLVRREYPNLAETEIKGISDTIFYFINSPKLSKKPENWAEYADKNI